MIDEYQGNIKVIVKHPLLFCSQTATLLNAHSNSTETIQRSSPLCTIFAQLSFSIVAIIISFNHRADFLFIQSMTCLLVRTLSNLSPQLVVLGSFAFIVYCDQVRKTFTHFLILFCFLYYYPALFNYFE